MRKLVTAVTISPQALRAIDKGAEQTKQSRSAFMEQASLERVRIVAPRVAIPVSIKAYRPRLKPAQKVVDSKDG